MISTRKNESAVEHRLFIEKGIGKPPTVINLLIKAARKQHKKPYRIAVISTS